MQTTQGPVAFCMHGRLDLEVVGRGAAKRPACAFGSDQAESLASASATRRVFRARWPRACPSGPPAPWPGSRACDTAAPAVPELHDDGSYTVPIRILRIHMEEDAAKMAHMGGEEGRIGGAAESLVDYSRCGTPLIELVTEPELRRPRRRALFMEKLRRIFLTIGISNCSMEKGCMRCDGNVLNRRRRRRPGRQDQAREPELVQGAARRSGLRVCRQAEVLENGGTVHQETLS